MFQKLPRAVFERLSGKLIHGQLAVKYLSLGVEMAHIESICLNGLPRKRCFPFNPLKTLSLTF